MDLNRIHGIDNFIGEKPRPEETTEWDIFKTMLKESFGRLLCRLGLPSFVENFHHEDPATGQELKISSSALRTVISFNDQDYYFSRLTGKFEGTGKDPSLFPAPYPYKPDWHYPHKELYNNN